MGQRKPDECMFCKKELEEWHYEYFEENGERAINSSMKYAQLKICKGCVKRLKGILDSDQDASSEDSAR